LSSLNQTCKKSTFSHLNHNVVGHEGSSGNHTHYAKSKYRMCWISHIYKEYCYLNILFFDNQIDNHIFTKKSIVVKVTQNWSFESVKIRARMVLSGARIWLWFFSLLVRQKSVAEWRNSGPKFASRKYNRNIFLG